MPVRVIITKGTTHDSTQAKRLIQGIPADCLLADKAYDSDDIVSLAEQLGMQVVIPPKVNRKTKREFDRHLYKLRHLIENTFLHLKRWRGVATRYAKNTASFLAAIQIRCIQLWGNII